MDPKLLSVSPRAFENVYHIGYLVPDLLEAMETLGQRLQIRWTTPFEMDAEFQTADGTTEVDRVRIVYSREGPPFLEMIEVVQREGAIFSQPAAGGFHHFGVYAQRWRDEVERMTQAGMILDRWGSGTAFVRDPQLGVRYEIVSFKGRQFLERILSGEMGEENPLSDPPRGGPPEPDARR